MNAATDAEVIDAVDVKGPAFARQAFKTLFLILAAHNLTETARDALFLAMLPASQLPWMYLLVAAASIPAGRATVAWSAGGRSALRPLLLSAAVISSGFWLLGQTGSQLFLYLLYLWPAIFSSVVVVEFWRVVSDAFTITEAKRVFGWLGAGGTAGALAGSALAVGMSWWLPTSSLLLAASVLFVAAAYFSPPSAGSEGRSEPDPESPHAGWAMVRSNRYLLGVAACLFVTTVTATLADFVFKTVVSRDLPAETLTRIFATVSFATSAATLLVQVVLVGPIIRRLGVTRALTVLPSALALAAGGVMTGGGLFSALALRVTDGTLRYSLHRAISDLLYVPLTPNVRARTKAFIDVLSQRTGQVAASVAILAGLALGSSYRPFAGAIVVLGLIVVGIAIRLRQPYLDLFRISLVREGTETRLAYPSLDVESLSSLVGAFSSDDERQVVAAMDLVAAQGEVRAIPVVMLFHPSPLVVLRALDLFEEHQREGFVWALDQIRAGGADPRIRAAALSAYARQCREPLALRAGLADDSEIVRMTALVGLVAGGWLDGDEAVRTLAENVAGASPAGKAALANAIRIQPSPMFEPTLLRLAETPDLVVRARTAEAMARMPAASFLAPLLTMLPDSVTRDPARRALVAAGQPALDLLNASLDDAMLSRDLRMHVPRTISRFPAALAMPVLWRRMLIETDDAIRFRVLRGIGRLVAEEPEARPDNTTLAEAIHEVSRAGLRFACWHVRLSDHLHGQRPSDTEELLLGLLAEKQDRATESVFRLLALSDVHEDFELVFRGLSGNRRQRASGRELIENVVPVGEREAVLTLTDDPIDRTSLAHFVDADASLTMSHHDTVAAIIRASTGPLRTLALLYAAEAGARVTQ